MHEPSIGPHHIDLADGRRLRCMGLWGPALVYEGPKGLGVLVSEDDTPKGVLLHVSASYPGHAPSWKDLRLLKDALFGDDKAAMMILPEASHYVNIHPNCWHLWEVPDGWSFTQTV